MQNKLKEMIMTLLKQRGSAILLPLAIIAVVAIVGVSAKYIMKKDDSALEEAAENYIKDETGKDIDFTPDSKEMGEDG